MTMRITACTSLLASIAFVMLAATEARAADVSKLAEDCANCHGKDGVSTEPDVPTIAGFSAPYLTDSLVAYKNKERPCPDAKYLGGEKKGKSTNMCEVAKALSDQDAAALAKHFAGKTFVRAKQAFDAAKAKQGEKIHGVSCKKCHENGGSSPDDDAGILAGQWMPYLTHTFEQYLSGKRPQPEKMKEKVDKLSKDDTEALVHYYGSFQ
jgi:cytochrome subunit of sulfide dehydrogenase